MVNLKQFTAIAILSLLLLNCAKTYQPKSALLEIDGRKMLVGDVVLPDIIHYFDGWKEVHQSASPSPEMISALKKVNHPIEIQCFLGTWCHDSRDGVPPFVKALNAANNPNITITFIGVNREKDDPEHLALQQNIQRVPTFIVFQEKAEIGRMIEFPLKESFVADFLDIVSE